MVGETKTAGGGDRPLINVFTCADKKYQDFSLLFALSNLYHVKDSVVEIGLEDPESFTLENRQALSLLDDEFGQGRVILRGARFRIGGRRVRPGAVRFVETPSKCDFVYISDIDIITLDPTLVDVHIAFMKRRALPYSNSVRRPNSSRMSGLHFARYDDWYPLPAFEDLLLQPFYDEQILRIICERKGFPVQKEEWFRPLHGIHVSPNRSPFGGMKNGVFKPGWGIGRYTTAYRRFADSPIMRELRPLFSERIQCYLKDIGCVCSALTTESLNEAKEELTLKYQKAALMQVRNRLVGNKEYAQASALELEYLARHPHDAAFHAKAASTFEQVGDIASAITHQRRAVELEPSNYDARRVLSRLLHQNGGIPAADAS
jgi:hypothetical protein